MVVDGIEDSDADFLAAVRRVVGDNTPVIVTTDLHSNHSAARLEATWRVVPSEAWDRATRDVGGRERPLRDLPARRWQELEVHAIDLGAGSTYEDWPDEFVGEWLPRLRSTVRARLPPGAPGPALDGLSERVELAWLYGRLTVARLPALAPWN
jgi:hypothetical protein